MWQFLLTAVVAGSTCFAAKRFFAQQASQCSNGEEVPTGDDANNSSQPLLVIPEAQNGVSGFTGRGDGPEKGVMGPGGKVRTVQCNSRSKWRLAFKKRRKTVNNIFAKTARKSITIKSSLLSPKKHAGLFVY